MTRSLIIAPMAEPPVRTVEENLAWEARWRPRAALLALVAGSFTLLGGIAASVTYTDFPSVSVLDGLRDAAGQPLSVGRGLRTSQLVFYDDKLLELLATAVVLSLGSLAIAGVLGYLYRATLHRNPGFSRLALIVAIAGPVMLAVAGIVLQVAISVKASSYVSDGDYSTAGAHDALQGGAVLAAQVLRQFGVLLLAVGFVLICLNAMRVGLLTRFMGILGMIVGALFVIPLGSNVPVVQCFWLIAVGFLIFGKWPNDAVPPAWASGEAAPWPSQMELREPRDRATAATRATAGEDAEDSDDDAERAADAPDRADALTEPPARRPSGQPTSRKRKNRKRR